LAHKKIFTETHKDERQNQLIPNKKLIMWCEKAALELLDSVILQTAPGSEEWHDATNQRCTIRQSLRKKQVFKSIPTEIQNQLVYEISTRQKIHPEAVLILGLGNNLQNYLKQVLNAIEKNIKNPDFSRTWPSDELNLVFKQLEVDIGLPKNELKDLIDKCKQFFEDFGVAKEFVLENKEKHIAIPKNQSGKEYVCAYCAHHFFTQQALAGHMKKHKKEKLENERLEIENQKAAERKQNKKQKLKQKQLPEKWKLLKSVTHQQKTLLQNQQYQKVKLILKY